MSISPWYLSVFILDKNEVGGRYLSLKSLNEEGNTTTLVLIPLYKHRLSRKAVTLPYPRIT